MHSNETIDRIGIPQASPARCPPIHNLQDLDARIFVGVQKVSRKGEIFLSDGSAHIILKKGRKVRSLVLTQDGPEDQYVILRDT